MNLRKIITIPLDAESLVIFDERGDMPQDALLQSGMHEATWTGCEVKASLGGGLTACMDTVGEVHVNQSVPCKLIVTPKMCVALVDLGEA